MLAHSPWLVGLSIIIAAQGSYVGLLLADEGDRAFGMRRRFILAASAFTLATSIWSMHFVAMLAARFPVMVGFRVLPTLVSLLICVLVVGAGVLIVHTERPKLQRILCGAIAMGAGIAAMHYVGMSAIDSCELHHSGLSIVASVLIAIAASSLTLWQMERSRPAGVAHGLPAVLFGLAIAGMHYSAMAGMTAVPIDLAPPSDPVMPHDTMAIVVAVVSFVISGGFLLSLTPDRRPPPAPALAAPALPAAAPAERPAPRAGMPASGHAPTAMPRPPSYPRQIEVQKDNRLHWLPVASIAFIRANGHYTLISDGEQEFFCQSAISEIEAQLDPVLFMRVHRSYIVSIGRVEAVRRAGDGGIAEIGAPSAQSIPVARGRLSAVRKRLSESHG
ncbi:MHYT domain-containing protein [Zavarzinia compransoris]|uniref:LytTR family transcriptional regulator n=1 Tax=Zavarzinia compransoris TaxID=1264899 RepID=A0A317E207_9PROT|nr:MHYT domain-containing protein [Zavarzinia compransoris]PWR21009.1 LytTR family transcriptional regulator [Zavarzinia compransoris]TDP44041.1 NO-binding membrane sensor protein with MHYT domain [Zavarzinia compransoris]